MDPLRILFFYQDFGADGGIERYIAQVSKWLGATSLPDGRRIEPMVACSANGPFYKRLQMLGIRVFAIESPAILGKSFLRSFDFSAWRALRRIVQTEKPDIAHVHIGLYETLKFQRWGIPVVFSFHGYGTLYTAQATSNPLKAAFKALSRHAFNILSHRLDALLVVSHSEQARLLHEGYLSPEAPGSVLSNGIDLPQWREQAKAVDLAALKASLSIPPASRCILFIGRLDPIKNPLHFVTLAEQLSQDSELQSDLPLHFLCVGDGPLISQVTASVKAIQEKLSTHPHAKPFHFHQLGFREDVSALLTLADLLVFPSSREGFGLGVLEAIALGVSCVAYASEGVAEILDVPILRDGLVPVGAVDQLVLTAKRLLQLPPAEKESLASAMAARAEAYGKPRFMQALLAQYRRLCPFVSVILPVYQGEDTIMRAVQSVLNQTYRHLELIVVDDGSSDGTLKLLQTISDPRLRVFSRENAGVAAARNFAFAQASGAYIAFIDADDLWLASKLQAEMALLRSLPQAESAKEPVCLVYSGYYAIDDADRLINLPPIRMESGNLSQLVIDDEGLFLPSTSLVHREIFEKQNGFQTGCYHEDRVFFIQACQQYPAYSTGKRLVLYRQTLAGRCRRVLAHPQEALEAELSIEVTLQGSLSDRDIERLSLFQKRNLFYRFLMYGYMRSATSLFNEFSSQPASLAVIQGKKGQLALVSLKTGINFLSFARSIVQALYKIFISPFWRKQRSIQSLFFNQKR